MVQLKTETKLKTKIKWKRKDPEVKDGDYFFDGQPYLTRGVSEKFSFEEIIYIIKYLQQTAIKNGGMDYLQVFENEEGERVWAMDQLTRKQIADHDDDWIKTNHFFTLLLPEEY